MKAKLWDYNSSRHRPEDGVVPTYARPVLLVLGLRVANRVELGRRAEHGAAEPDGVALHVVADDLHTQTKSILQSQKQTASSISLGFRESVDVLHAHYITKFIYVNTEEGSLLISTKPFDVSIPRFSFQIETGVTRNKKLKKCLSETTDQQAISYFIGNR